MSPHLSSHTPQQASYPAAPHVRRSFTSPSHPSPRPDPRSASANIEILFSAPSSKVVSFATASPAQRPSSAHPAVAARSGQERDAPTTSIAWTAPTERTLAVGPLRIYRVTTSNVSFLNSGHLLHTIFPRSQCWCVDNQSTFVLRVRQDSYYRIELPYDTDEDKERIVQFKTTLSQVLQYERTQCPFARGFEVDHVDRPTTPPRPRSRQQLQPTQKAKKWLFDKSWVPEDSHRPCTPVLAGSDCGTTSSYDDDDDRSSVYTDNSEAMLESPRTLGELAPPRSAARRLSIAERVSFFQDMRSASLPGLDTRAGSITSLKRIPESAKVEPTREPVQPSLDRRDSEAASSVSSSSSFYSFDSSTSSPFMNSNADPISPLGGNHSKQEHGPRGRSLHRRQISDATVRPCSPKTMPSVDAGASSVSSALPHADNADAESTELPILDVSAPSDAIVKKRLTGASQRRAFSPMPHVPTLLFRAQRRHSGRELTNALVRKTCELVLGPPAHLVSLMLRIARNISGGLGFKTSGTSASEPASCAWESKDEAHWTDEDDFGIPLNHMDCVPKRRRTFSGEVD